MRETLDQQASHTQPREGWSSRRWQAAHAGARRMEARRQSPLERSLRSDVPLFRRAAHRRSRCAPRFPTTVRARRTRASGREHNDEVEIVEQHPITPDSLPRATACAGSRPASASSIASMIACIVARVLTRADHEEVGERGAVTESNTTIFVAFLRTPRESHSEVPPGIPAALPSVRPTGVFARFLTGPCAHASDLPWEPRRRRTRAAGCTARPPWAPARRSGVQRAAARGSL